MQNFQVVVIALSCAIEILAEAAAVCRIDAAYGQLFDGQAFDGGVGPELHGKGITALRKERRIDILHAISLEAAEGVG